MMMEVSHRVSIIILRSIVSIVPVPVIATQVTIATIVEANSALPSWEIAVTVKMRSVSNMMMYIYMTVHVAFSTTSIIPTYFMAIIVTRSISYSLHSHMTIAKMHLSHSPALRICIHISHQLLQAG